MIIIVRDCFEPTYIKLVGAINVVSIIMDFVWISFYKVLIGSICLEHVERNGQDAAELGRGRGPSVPHDNRVLHLQLDR